MQKETEINVERIEELDPSKIYHVVLPKNPTVIQDFIQVATKLGLKMLITDSEVKFESLKDLFKKLSREQKATLMAILIDKPIFTYAPVIDPRDHEQSK